MRQGTEYKLYLLTNMHVVQDNCGNAKFCTGSKVVHDVGLEYKTLDAITNPNAVSLNLVRWTSYGYNPFWIKDPVVEKISSDSDLAVISVRATKTQAESMKPIRFHGNCKDVRIGDDVYVIGFPSTPKRRIMSVPISNQNMIVKRWSKGRITGEEFFHVAGAVDDVYMTSSADTIGGNSGSPVLDMNGLVIGVHAAGSAGSFGNSSYAGESHSKSVRCEKVRAFVRNLRR